VLAASALVFFVVGALIWWIVRDDPQERGYASYAAVDNTRQGQTFAGAAQGIGQVFRYQNTWLLFLIPGGLVGPVLTFAGLWGVPFLTTHYRLPDAQAAAICTTLLVSFAVSGPVLGALSDKIGRRKPLYVAGSVLAAISWSVLIFVPGLSRTTLVALIVAIGLGSSSMIIGFAFVKESVALRLAGTVSGVINTGVMLGPMLLQPGVGWMLDQRWQGEMEAGIRVYNLYAYQAGFTLMLVWSLLACVLILFTHETHCRQFEPDPFTTEM
jgi:sugar phosphate permease